MDTFAIPYGARRVLNLLEAAGFEAYVVGGCVRDALLGVEPSDWDICTSARPEQVKAVMAAAHIACADTGIKHGTVTVIVDGEPFETTTYRADGAYTDGRHPDSVAFLGRIDGDLARRDFTVNAMAYSPKRGFVDRFDGRADLATGTLRCVGTPHERFSEDALRIMRALRFSSTYGFAVEPATAAALHADRELLAKVSSERVWAELSRLLVGPGAVDVLREFSDVIAVVIPELAPTFGFDQQNPFHAYDVWEHTLHALAAAPPDMDAACRFALLLHDIAKPQCFFKDDKGVGHAYGHEEKGEPVARAICKRLRVPNEVGRRVAHLVRWHMFSIPDTPKAMRRFLLKHGERGARDLFALRRCDKAGLGRPIPDDAPLSVAFAKAEALMDEQLNAEPLFGVRDLALGGRDLMALGFAQGPAIGAALQRLLKAVVDGELPNERDALAERAKALLEHDFG